MTDSVAALTEKVRQGFMELTGLRLRTPSPADVWEARDALSELAALASRTEQAEKALRVALDCKGSYEGTVSKLGGYPATRPEEVTHGRHCPCSACAREDWTRPELASCGMHGASCPAVYAPIPSSTRPNEGGE